MRLSYSRELWGIVWRSENRLDGAERRFVFTPELGLPIMFRTRREARAYCEDKYGYIRRRKDLREEPFGWRMPQVVRILVTTKDTP